MENENKETFQYTYSAKQQEEINVIREKYLPKGRPTPREEKLKQLRKLDASADQLGMMVGIPVGTVGAALFALGMVCVTSEWSKDYFVPGVVVGVLGIICMAVALPLCHFVVARRREQLAPEVLRLTEELSEENS